jgi:hypothetical protein
MNVVQSRVTTILETTQARQALHGRSAKSATITEANNSLKVLVIDDSPSALKLLGYVDVTCCLVLAERETACVYAGKI